MAPMAVRGEDLMGQLEGELKTSMAEPSRILQMVGMPSFFGVKHQADQQMAPFWTHQMARNFRHFSSYM